MSSTSRTYQLIEERLDGTLADYVRERRPAQATWRQLAAEIEEKTGVNVSYETLRSWFTADRTESGGAA